MDEQVSLIKVWIMNISNSAKYRFPVTASLLLKQPQAECKRLNVTLLQYNLIYKNQSHAFCILIPSFLSCFTLFSYIYIPHVINLAPILTFSLTSLTVSISKLHVIFFFFFPVLEQDGTISHFIN